ncbi:MAG: preprotein translocase subunit SecE [Nitrospiraceae bacterium]
MADGDVEHDEGAQFPSLKNEGEVGMFRKFIDSIREFLNDVRGELKKVSFPTRAETIGSTTVVIVFCIIMSLYLSFVDSILVWLVSKIV